MGCPLLRKLTWNFESQDFDGGSVGQAVVNGLTSTQTPSGVMAWRTVNASEFPGGVSQLGYAVVQQKAWAAVASCVDISSLYWIFA